MRQTATLIVVLAAAAAIVPAATGAGDPSGIVYRRYAVGYRFNPLLSFANLNRQVSDRNRMGARRLADALLARGIRRGGALYWEYDFSFGGGPAPWTSGFTQIVAAQALARAAVLLHDPSLLRAANTSFAALGHGLLLHVGRGVWVREYGFTRQVILNAQLQSILSVESYAQTSLSPFAAALAVDLERTTRRLLPRFDLGCWARYQLGGVAADAHYEAYHVELLRRIATTHVEPIWRKTYLRWKRCV
jgi:hypothetical protein